MPIIFTAQLQLKWRGPIPRMTLHLQHRHPQHSREHAFEASDSWQMHRRYGSARLRKQWRTPMPIAYKESYLEDSGSVRGDYKHMYEQVGGCTVRELIKSTHHQYHNTSLTAAKVDPGQYMSPFLSSDSVNPKLIMYAGRREESFCCPSSPLMVPWTSRGY